MNKKKDTRPRYTYFVSYAWYSDKGNGEGMTTLTFRKSISE